MYLPSNASGADNLASNADVVSGAQRGTNGLSSANLRGQGNASTLVLLNGRRVAAHGLQGSAVDVNQIPFAAIERIEILKDGASAIYGTDAIGGVINFITRTDYQGVGVQGFVDVTEAWRRQHLPGLGHRRLWRPPRAGLQRHGRGLLQLEPHPARLGPGFRQRQPAQSRALDRHARRPDRDACSTSARTSTRRRAAPCSPA